ncbi:MAG TPA: SDR family oxidoreductase [Acidimicrobiales bacterium]|nr:SDR family oxidoreductase [Acidimicrobiales bacterium]
MRAIVTGAARGLGEAIATRIVEDGGDVVLVDVDPAVEVTAKRLSAKAPAATIAGVVADVALVEECASAVSGALAVLGGVDLLVNNAGIGGPSTPVVSTEPEAFRHVLDVNLVGTFLVSRLVASAMLAQGAGGSIVNMGSLFGQQGVPGGAAYSASKAGVALLTQSMARELAPQGIRVNAIAPGHMATEMHWDELRARAERAGTSFEEQLAAVRAEIPLGRHGTGADIAGVVTWLASADASYVTGQTIGVNGGVFHN